MIGREKKMSKLKRILCMAGSVFALFMLGALNVQAREVVVEDGNIQAALDLALTETEVLTVVIPAGDYTITNYSLYVYSDIVIRAEGAKITTAAAGYPVLTALNRGNTFNVTVQGGTWVANGAAPLQVVGMGNSVYDSVTVDAGSGGCMYGFDLLDSTGITIKNCLLNNCGINAQNSSGLTISNNTIQSAPALGIRVAATGNNTISGNSVINSGRTGIQLEHDTASVVDGNTVTGSALTGVNGDHGEGLVINTAEGTRVTNNHVTDTHSNVPNNGNGIIVAGSKNVVVEGNVVTNSGNHGIQVSYSSENISVGKNEISGSGRMGISISRGSHADLAENKVSASKVSGIVYDGTEGACRGTIDNCTVTDTQGQASGDAGILSFNSSVTVKNCTVADSGKMGLLVKGSTAIVENNRFYQTDVRENTTGVHADSSSRITLNGNQIGNFGFRGIAVAKDSVAKGTNNTVTIKNLTGTEENAILVMENPESEIMNNTIIVFSLGTASASGQNFFDTNVEIGLIIDGKKTATAVPSGGKFSFEYPAQASTDNIILYAKTTDGNVICVNAPNGFTLDGRDNDVDMEKVKAFVERLYQNTLGRLPDERGLKNWVDLLAEGKMTGAEVAHGFFFSDEFIAKELNNTEYVDILYHTMFGQAGDEAGRAFWINDLETGFSRLYIYHGFAESKQFQDLCAAYGIKSGQVQLVEARDLNRGVTKFVSRNYTKALGRKVDYEGLNTWCNEIINKGMAPEKVVEGFIFSDEFIEKNLSDADFVNTMYATYFDRDADAAGYNTWMDILANGGSRRDVMNGFSGADEFHDLVASFELPQ